MPPESKFGRRPSLSAEAVPMVSSPSADGRLFVGCHVIPRSGKPRNYSRVAPVRNRYQARVFSMVYALERMSNFNDIILYVEDDMADGLNCEIEKWAGRDMVVDAWP